MDSEFIILMELLIMPSDIFIHMRNVYANSSKWASYVVLGYISGLLTQMSRCDGLQSNRLHCSGPQDKLMGAIVETLQWS